MKLKENINNFNKMSKKIKKCKLIKIKFFWNKVVQNYKNNKFK